MKQGKYKKGMERLMMIAGEKRGMLTLLRTLWALSAVLLLSPFIFVYKVLEALLLHAGDLEMVNERLMICWGLAALFCLVGGLLLRWFGLMASHMAVSRILRGIRAKLGGLQDRPSPGHAHLAFSGFKDTLEQNAKEIEHFDARATRGLVYVAATAPMLLGAIFTLNVWTALACLALLLAGFGIQVSMVFGKEAQKHIKDFFSAKDGIKPELCFAGHMQRRFSFIKVMSVSLLTLLFPVGLLVFQGSPQSLSFALTYLVFTIIVPGASAPLFRLAMLASLTSDMNEKAEQMEKLLSGTQDSL